MAIVARTTRGNPSLASTEPPAGHRTPAGLLAGEDLEAFDACRIASDGKAYRSSGAAADANANIHGWAARKVKAGRPITLFFHERAEYANGTLTPGQSLYLSGVTAGRLDTAASTGGNQPCAYAIDAYRIYLLMDVRR